MITYVRRRVLGVALSVALFVVLLIGIVSVKVATRLAYHGWDEEPPPPCYNADGDMLHWDSPHVDWDREIVAAGGCHDERGNLREGSGT